MASATIRPGGQRDSRALFCLQCGLYIAGIACLIAIFLFIRHLDSSLTQTLQNASQAIAGIQTTQTKLNATLDALNRPCVAGNCGLIAGGEFDEHEALVAIGQVEIMANMEKHHFQVQLAQEKQIADATGKAIGDVDTTVRSANRTIQSFQPVIGSLKQNADDLQLTQQQLQALLADAQPGMKSLSGTMANVDGMTADTEKWLHIHEFPPPCKTLKCRVMKTFAYMGDVIKVTEGAYWTKQLFTNSSP